MKRIGGETSKFKFIYYIKLNLNLKVKTKENSKLVFHASNISNSQGEAYLEAKSKIQKSIKVQSSVKKLIEILVFLLVSKLRKLKIVAHA